MTRPIDKLIDKLERTLERQKKAVEDTELQITELRALEPQHQLPMKPKPAK